MVTVIFGSFTAGVGAELWELPAEEVLLPDEEPAGREEAVDEDGAEDTGLLGFTGTVTCEPLGPLCSYRLDAPSIMLLSTEESAGLFGAELSSFKLAEAAACTVLSSAFL